MLTTAKNLNANFESEKKQGALSANVATLHKQVENLQKQISSTSNPTMELKALWAKNNADMICNRCAKKGHGKKRCRAPVVKCGVCSEDHATSRHEAVMQVHARYEAKRSGEDNSKRQAHVAEVAYDIDEEETMDRQDEDELEEYCGIDQLCDIDNNSSCYGGFKLAGFTATIYEDEKRIEVEEPKVIIANTASVYNEEVRHINTVVRDVLINELEYHYLSDDEDSVIETIIPEYSTNVIKSKQAIDITKEAVISKTDTSEINTLYYCKDRNKCSTAHSIDQMSLCKDSAKIVRPKRAAPSRPTENNN